MDQRLIQRADVSRGNLECGIILQADRERANKTGAQNTGVIDRQEGQG